MKSRHNEDAPRSLHQGRGHGRGRHAGDPLAAGQAHNRREGRGRLARFFEHGDLRLVALQLISEKPRHGYEIIKAIEEKSGGAYTPSAGAIYPTLTLLQELGQITVSDGEDGRKLHAITAEGSAALVANRKSVDAIFARIALAGESRDDVSPAISDAFRKLKQTLRLRLSRGPLDEARVKLLVEKLTEVSDAVEKL